MMKWPLFDILNDSVLHLNRKSKLKLISTPAVSNIVDDIMSRVTDCKIFNLVCDDRISLEHVVGIADIDMRKD